MTTIFLWASIGVFLLFVLFGFLAGAVTGWKRSALHAVFFGVSVLVAFSVTRVIATAILGIRAGFTGGETLQQYILNQIASQFDLTSLGGTASQFVQKLPAAIVSPILFIFVTILVCIFLDIVYAIVARIAFGKKKKDFKEHKPRRLVGGMVGMVEGFFILVVMFCPITALTKTYEEVTYVAQSQAQTAAMEEEQHFGTLPSLSEVVKNNVPDFVDEMLTAYNNCAIGKVVHVSKIDYAIFDGLSRVKLDNENVKLRKEGLEIAKTYDQVAQVANNVGSGNFENIDLTQLKVAIEKILDGGLFKKLISDTAKSYIENYQPAQEENSSAQQVEEGDVPEESTPSAPSTQVLDEFMLALKAKVAEENFNMFEYLKNDIMKLLDIADILFKSDILKDVQAGQSTDVWDIMEIVLKEDVPQGEEGKQSNMQSVQAMGKEFFKLNLVSDCFSPICNLASTELEKAINKDNLEVSLNSNIDKDKLVDELLGGFNQLVALNDSVNLSELVKTKNLLEKLNEIPNLQKALKQLGAVLDTFRELEIFVLPQTETRPQPVYVLDNVLSAYNFTLLGDKVYKDDSTESEEIKTYSHLFDFLSVPIAKAQQFGLLNFENVQMDTLIDTMLDTLKTEEDLFAKILTPFYQLEKVNINGKTLKDMVFNQIVDYLAESITLLDFSGVKAENSLATWRTELTLLGRTINALNQGEIEVTTQGSTEKKTFLKYVLSDNFNLETLLNAMVESNAMEEILQPVFDSKAFAPLVEDVFAQIDNSIQSLTGVNPNTNLSNLQATKTQTIKTICEIMESTVGANMQELKLEVIGQMLNILKDNAFNDQTDDGVANGTKDGVFNNVFANLIWYLTGKSINGVDYGTNQPNPNTNEINELLNLSDENNFQEYYTTDYASILAGLDDVVSLAKALLDNMPPIAELNTKENVEAFVNGLQASFNQLDESVDKTELIIKLADVIDGREGVYDFITEADKTNQNVITAINMAFADEEGLSDAIFKLLGISAGNN